jgi:hypothetical protein
MARKLSVADDGTRQGELIFESSGDGVWGPLQGWWTGVLLVASSHRYSNRRRRGALWVGEETQFLGKTFNYPVHEQYLLVVLRSIHPSPCHVQERLAL